MLTPRFELDQDDRFVIVTIYAPFTNISETEIFMDDLDFRFFSKPYFLRLHLPKEVEETDIANAEYNADTNSFVIKVPKKNSGEFFPGLDMLSELLKPKGGMTAQEQIEEFDENGELLEDIDCYFEQNIQASCEKQTIQSESNSNCYGFGFTRSNVFNRLLDECQEILDIKDLDLKTINERRKQRKQLETNAFNEDHYLADTFETNDELIDILNLDSKWKNDIALSSEHKQRMITLGTQKRCKLKIEKEDVLSVSLGLLDILFAFCYDFRTTDWEHNTESAWTISKLCATLSCGEKYSTTNECVITGIRRSLCYPLYRNWELSVLVWKDVCDLLKNSGKIGILHVLLSLIPVFLTSEGYYLYNQMYVEDYVLWCQSLSDKWVAKCLESLQSCIDTIAKEHIGLNIDKLELYAKNILENQSEKDVSTEVDLLQKIADLQINEDNVDSDDSYDDESDSSSSDSSETSSDSEAETNENNTSKELLCQPTDKSSIVGATVNCEDVVK